MNLELQILSLIFSFSFGIVLSYLYNLFYNFLNYKIRRYNILINILFFLNVFLIYFIMLILINDGIIHIYFLFLLILGFLLFLNKSKSLGKIIKVSVNKSKLQKK